MDNLNAISIQTNLFCEALKREIVANGEHTAKKIKMDDRVNRALMCLVSESTANGASSSKVRELIIGALPENALQPEIKQAYLDYHSEATKCAIFSKNISKINKIKFFSLTIMGFWGFSSHHITGLVRQLKDGCSLTIANAGYGATEHIAENGKRCTVMTTPAISEEKILSFFNFIRKVSGGDCIFRFTVGRAKDLFYQKMKELVFSKTELKWSFTDHYQLAGSCSGRSELLILKHLMKIRDYRQLKINLSEKFILQSAMRVNVENLSITEKIVTLDATRRLCKRYEKSGMKRDEEIFLVLEEFQKRVNIQSHAKENLTFLKTIPQETQEVLKNCLFAVYHLEAYAFNDARMKIRESIKDLNNDFPTEFSENDIKSFKIFINQLEHLLKNKESLKSLDQRDLFSGLLIISYRLKSIVKVILNENKYKHFIKKLKSFIYNRVDRASFVDEAWKKEVQHFL